MHNLLNSFDDADQDLFFKVSKHLEDSKFVLWNITNFQDHLSEALTQRKVHISKSILFIHWTILNIIKKNWFVIWPLIIEEEYINKYRLKEIQREELEQSQDAPGMQISHLQRNYINVSIIISNSVSTRHSIGKMADSTTTNVM